MVVSLSISRVLPASILGISHIPELVTAYLLPRTIDAAVYNDLHTAVQVYGDFPHWTVGAMDGAAARGRLDICQFLHATRTEGCSADAFTGASLYGYDEILRWLIHHYPDMYDPEECLAAGVDAGQVGVLRFLNQRMGVYDKTSYLNTAATKGYAEVVDALRPWGDNRQAISQPLCLAVVNGHEEVYNLLVETVSSDVARLLNNLAMEVAVKSGQAGMVRLLLRKDGVDGGILEMNDAARFGHVEVMEVLLAECKLPHICLISSALKTAAENDRSAVVDCLLRHFAGQDEDAITAMTIKYAISEAFSAAVKRGSVEMVKTLVGRCPGNLLGQELQEAGIAGNLEVVKLLLSECERRNVEVSTYRENVAAVVQRAAQRALLSAASNGHLEMVKVLLPKVDTVSVDRALEAAATKGELDVVELLRGRCSTRGLNDAMSSGCANGHEEIVRVLKSKCRRISGDE